MAFSVQLEIDWKLLRDQKLAVIGAIDSYGDGLLGGVVELIDAIQAAGEKSGEPVVWMEEDEE